MAVLKEGDTYYIFDYAIGNENYYMGVMLQRDAQTQYLYLHNVALEKEMSDSSKTHLLTTGVNEENKHLFTTIVLQPAIDVKLKKQKSVVSNEKTLNKRFALPNDPENSDGSSAPFDAEAVIARGIPRTSGRMNITVGELARMEANYTKQKVYSKKNALSVVNQFAGVSDLTQKTRTEIADAV